MCQQERDRCYWYYITDFLDEIELQDYKTPQYAQPQTHNGYMPVSREVPVYVDAQGNMVHY